MYKEYQSFKTTLLLTGSDIEGPYYTPGAPFRDHLIENPTLKLSGKVTNQDGTPFVDTVLDFWMANEKGEYDNEGFVLRGKVKTDSQGEYSVFTVHPGHYAISDHEFRCAHIHVKIRNLTTQLYFSDDVYNAQDHWFNKDRVVTFLTPDHAKFDFVVA